MAITKINLPASILMGAQAKKDAQFQNFWDEVLTKKITKNPGKQVSITVDLSDASFHSTSSGSPKDETVEDIDSIDVNMRTMYKDIGFDDYEYEGAPEDLKAAIKNELPAKLRETIVKAMLGTTEVPGSPFPGFTNAAKTITTDPYSWVEAVETVEAAGYTPNAWLLSTKAKALLRTAFTTDANTNALRDDIHDGTPVVSIPAYFGKFNNAATAGVLADWTRVYVVIYADITVNEWTPDSSHDQFIKDQTNVTAKLRVGVAVADQSAAQVLAFA